MYRDASSCLELPSSSPVGFSLRAQSAWLKLCGWRELYRQRRALLALDDAMLKDIGISRVDALREGSKPFWRP
ncbi:MAG: DUF1127 domain-containing protein [Candidatus Competibacteraceae bacterium]|nr:DUF1127 domain-containing protein [Candidatus Competibacteraceae bacterium]